MESEGKGDGHQYGRKPLQDTRANPNSWELTYSEEEMGHWTPPGVEPRADDDDDDDEEEEEYKYTAY